MSKQILSIFLIFCLISLSYQQSTLSCTIKKKPNTSYDYFESFDDCFKLANQDTKIIYIQSDNNGLDLNLGDLLLNLQNISGNLVKLYVNLNNNDYTDEDLLPLKGDFTNFGELKFVYWFLSGNQLTNFDFISSLIDGESIEQVYLDFSNNPLSDFSGLQAFEEKNNLGLIHLNFSNILNLSINDDNLWKNLNFVIDGQIQLQMLSLDFSNNNVSELKGLYDALQNEELSQLKQFRFIFSDIEYTGDGEDQVSQYFQQILNKMTGLTKLNLNLNSSQIAKDFEDLEQMFNSVSQTLTDLELSLQNVEFSTFNYLKDALKYFGEPTGQLEKININFKSDNAQNISDFEDFCLQLSELPNQFSQIMLNFDNVLPEGAELNNLFEFVGYQNKNLIQLSLDFSQGKNLQNFYIMEQNLSLNTELQILSLNFYNCQELQYEHLARGIKQALIKTSINTLILNLDSTLREVLTANTAQEQAELFFKTAFDSESNNLKYFIFNFSHNTKVLNYDFLENAFKSLKQLQSWEFIIQNSNLGDFSAISKVFQNQKGLKNLFLNLAYSTVESLEPFRNAFVNLTELYLLRINLDFMGLQEVSFLTTALQRLESLVDFQFSAELNNISDLSPLSTSFIKNTNLQYIDINLLGNTNIIDISALEYSFVYAESIKKLHLNLQYQNDNIDYTPLNTILYNQYNQIQSFRLTSPIMEPENQTNNQLEIENQNQNQSNVKQIYQVKSDLELDLEAVTWNLINLSAQKQRFQFGKDSALLQSCQNSENLCVDCGEEEGKCSECIGNLESSECTQCIVGNFMDQSNGFCYSCGTLVEQCNQCDSEYNCVSCEQNYKLNSYGICYKESCSENCAECDQNDQQQKCLKCSQGYTLQQDGSCAEQICESTQQGDSLLEGCSFCPFAGICSKCGEDYELIGESGKCQVRNSGNSGKTWIIVGSVIGGLLVLAGVGYAVYRWRQGKQREEEEKRNERLIDEELK